VKELVAYFDDSRNEDAGLQELVDYLRRELDFPQGVFLMTGTGIVPPDDFSLAPGDLVRITIGELTLENEVGP
jgi:2-dehydro-3-deoxy-D-arabinonate dehydratase